MREISMYRSDSSAIHIFLYAHVIRNELILLLSVRQKWKNVMQHLRLKNKGKVQIAQILLKMPLFLTENKLPRHL